MIRRKYVIGHRATKGGRYEGTSSLSWLVVICPSLKQGPSGEWKMGKLNGIGTLMNAAGDMIYVGEFRHSEGEVAIPNPFASS